MMIDNGDNTMTGGPLDVLLILHDETTNKYHPAFLEEKPMPGPVPEVGEMTFVRLKSRMHHTAGFASLEEAQTELDDMATKIKLQPENILRAVAIEWDGQIGFVWVVANWRREGSGMTLLEAFGVPAGSAR